MYKQMSDSNKITAFILIIVLLLVAIYIWRIWLDHQQKIAQSDAIVEMSKQETERMKLIVEKLK